MTTNDVAIFVCELRKPVNIVIYPSLDSAQRSIEGLDIEAGDLAFTANGQIVHITAAADLSVEIELTDRIDRERLQGLLRTVRGTGAPGGRSRGLCPGVDAARGPRLAEAAIRAPRHLVLVPEQARHRS